MENRKLNPALWFYFSVFIAVLMIPPADLRQAMHLGLARNLTGYSADYEATTFSPHIEETSKESDSAEGVNLILCEYGKMKIQCPDPAANVVITHADYGRHESGDVQCPHPSILTTNCSSPEATQQTAKICEGKNTCEIFASNSIYGDPCVYTYKYLTVRFVCTSAVAKSISGYKPSTYLT